MQMFRPFISFAIANIRDLYQTAKEKMWGNMVYSFPPRILTKMKFSIKILFCFA